MVFILRLLFEERNCTSQGATGNTGGHPAKVTEALKKVDTGSGEIDGVLKHPSPWCLIGVKSLPHLPSGEGAR